LSYRPLLALVVCSLLCATACLDWDTELLQPDASQDLGADGRFDSNADGRPDADARPEDGPKVADLADSAGDIADGTGDGSDDSDGQADAPGGLSTNGSPCLSDETCLSGHCADGVCCNGVCSGDCESCALTGTQGDCRPVPDGESPAMGKTCVAGTGCGLDGQCDGRGGCRFGAAGTICQQPSCNSTIRELAKVCDGSGACIMLASTPQVSCTPYKCDFASKTCSFTCTKKNDCTTKTCTALACAGGGRPLGSPCSTGGVCDSGHCVDGVCCESVCDGLCETCALPGLEGRCVNIPAGQPEPSGSCVASGPCGNDGSCDGAGGCRKTPAGTPCGATTCVTGAVDDLLRRSICDGSGGCGAVDSSCGSYRCQPGIGSCYGRCESNSQCKVGSCSGGRCQ
jgi:hypothetical protein